MINNDAMDDTIDAETWFIHNSENFKKSNKLLFVAPKAQAKSFEIQKTINVKI